MNWITHVARIAKLELGYSCDKTMSTLKIHTDGDKKQLCHGSQVHFVYVCYFITWRIKAAKCDIIA